MTDQFFQLVQFELPVWGLAVLFYLVMGGAVTAVAMLVIAWETAAQRKSALMKCQEENHALRHRLARFQEGEPFVVNELIEDAKEL